MKIFLSLLFLLLSYGGVFAETPLGSYPFYLESVNQFCKPTDNTLWKDWKNESLITIEQIQYADITSTTSDTIYKKYLEKI